MHRHTRLGAAGAAVALSLVATTGCASTRPQPDPTATLGEAARGRTVARADVDGDGVRDVVTYQRLRGDRVRIGVRTDRFVARRVLDTALWPGPGGEWHGAAPLDGVPGVELVVGTARGAHTPFFTVLTMRRGDLRVQRSPATGDRQWWVDAFYNGHVGWSRLVGDGSVQVVRRELFRRGDGRLWRGEAHRFRWAEDGWSLAGHSELRARGDRQAARVGGWHVPGLARWPSD